MAIYVQVFAPNIGTDVIEQLSLAIVDALNTSVVFDGYYGAAKKRPAVFSNLGSLISGIELNHYWAVVGLHLRNVAPDALRIITPILINEGLGWAKKHKQDKTTVKFKLYGPDDKLISEEDA